MEKAVKAPIALLLLLAMFSSELGMAESWTLAYETFYGGSDGSGTMGNYARIKSSPLHDFSLKKGELVGTETCAFDGYGINSAALSTALFNNGAACGTCYQILNSQWCKEGKYIIVKATNFCPPNYNGGWCNPPRQHFDMSQPAWKTIAIYRGASVKCQRSGGIRFTINGNNYFELVVISNIRGSGVISGVWIKGSNTNWMVMSRNWGMNWQSNECLNGQALSFRLQTDEGRVVTAYNVAPAGWWFGSSYASVQF